MDSMMKMEKFNGRLRFYGVLMEKDFPNLDSFDRMLMDQCGNHNATAADWLLALECIFRRIEQQNSLPTENVKD